MSFEFDFNEKGLKGRTILLAGGSGGLGSAACALLARDGASLIIGFKNEEKKAEDLAEFLRRQYDAEVVIAEGDITTDSGRKNLIEAAANLSQPLSDCVCLVGDPARVKFDSAGDRDLHDSFEKNYVGPLLLARESVEAIQESGISGSIVLFSTMQAVALFESSINYAGPKSALIHAARIMARQYGGPGGVRVNVIAPGVNRAGMALDSIASGKYDFFVDEGIIPRYGRAEDVAKVVRLLVEPDSYLTGQVLTVDGGLTIRR